VSEPIAPSVDSDANGEDTRPPAGVSELPVPLSSAASDEATGPLGARPSWPPGDTTPTPAKNSHAPTTLLPGETTPKSARTSRAPTTLPTIPADRLTAVHDALLGWYGRVGRDLPWRRTRDPYAILVSEIMLQQTQVDRVIPKLRQFLDAFPTLAALAAAPVSEVIRVWAGLGYNRRAVRLHAIAREAVERLGGALPTTPDALRELDGLGQYTANAVACFSAEAQVAVVDTNVRRVLGRVFADEIGLDPVAGPALQRFADAVLPAGQAYPWNQALMDLGATICTSRNPAHDVCPLALHCTGRALMTHTEPLWSAAEGSEPLRRAAESATPYTVGPTAGGPTSQPPTRPTPRKAARKESLPFEQTTRYFRGRIVDACRNLAPGETLGLDDLGRALRPGYGPDDRPWIDGLVAGLRRDGLVAVTESQGEPRVSLP
jgi:A/G-specific adenine glycosylase